jgi:alpha-galactosidase/6-phospho-beta-glucosidase family protein
LSKNKELAFQAIFNDPSNPLDLDSAWEMYTRLLQASRAFLPGWNLN